LRRVVYRVFISSFDSGRGSHSVGDVKVLIRRMKFVASRRPACLVSLKVIVTSAEKRQRVFRI